jgi:prolyl oligopeptidase
MLRYDQLTGGRAFVSEYGSAADPAGFKALYAYSPYHNVKDKTRYPPVFLATADHDNRVAPAHSLKFAARLQKAQAGEAPVLLQVMKNRGHGSGGRSASLAGITDQLAFIMHFLKMKLPEDF